MEIDLEKINSKSELVSTDDFSKIKHSLLNDYLFRGIYYKII